MGAMSTRMPSTGLVDLIADQVDTHYVFAGAAHRIAEAVRGAAPGLPDPSGDPGGFASSITRHLRAASSDRHLSVRHHPEGVQDEQDDATWQRWWAAEARRTAGGVAAVTRSSRT